MNPYCANCMKRKLLLYVINSVLLGGSVQIGNTYAKPLKHDFLIREKLPYTSESVAPACQRVLRWQIRETCSRSGSKGPDVII